MRYSVYLYYFAGHAGDAAEYERGLFRNLFEHTVKRDAVLRDILPSIPRNASYLSPEIQNDVISTFAEMVAHDIASDIKNADVPW